MHKFIIINSYKILDGFKNVHILVKLIARDCPMVLVELLKSVLDLCMKVNGWMEEKMDLEDLFKLMAIIILGCLKMDGNVEKEKILLKNKEFFKKVYLKKISYL